MVHITIIAIIIIIIIIIIIMRNSRRNLETFKQNSAFSNIGEHCTENHFFYILKYV
jgi:hypothetical protein